MHHMSTSLFLSTNDTLLLSTCLRIIPSFVGSAVGLYAWPMYLAHPIHVLGNFIGFIIFHIAISTLVLCLVFPFVLFFCLTLSFLEVHKLQWFSDFKQHTRSTF